MKTVIIGLSILFLAYNYTFASGIRSRTGVYKRAEMYTGRKPVNISSPPGINFDSREGVFVKLEIVLDPGRSISNFDYVLRSIDGMKKFKCVAVSEGTHFDVENWLIGPFKEAKIVNLLFYLPTKRLERGEDFLLSFNLPVGYDAPDINISLDKSFIKKTSASTSLASKQKNEPEPDRVKIVKAENKSERPKKTSIDKMNDGSFEGKIESIYVRRRSFTVHVKTEDGKRHRICLHGIVPAQDQGIHNEIEKILNKKYRGIYVKVVPNGKDRHGRIIAKIYSEDKYINREMISDGLAFHSPEFAPNDTELQNIK